MRPFLDQLWRSSSLAMNRQEAKIFVGGLNWSTSEEKLRSYFENFGSVQEAFVSYDRHTGRPRGFGFVVFEDPLVADKVVSIQHTIDRREVTLLRAFESCRNGQLLQQLRFKVSFRWKPRRLFPRTISLLRAMEACSKRNGHVKYLWGVWHLPWTSWPSGSESKLAYKPCSGTENVAGLLRLGSSLNRPARRAWSMATSTAVQPFLHFAQVLRAVRFCGRRCGNVRSRQQTSTRVWLYQLLQ